MRPIYLTAILFVALVFHQDVKRHVLSSHDRIDGPFGGEYHVSDLQVFEDGKVIYAEEGTKSMGGKPEHSTYQATLSSDEMRRLAALLDSRDIRSLPTKISSKTRPIDFFWQKSVEINRLDKTQKVQIENFYPFLNLNGLVYPKGLIQLECRLQDIKTEVTKRSQPNDEGNWCKELLEGSSETSVQSAQADCREDKSQPTIVAGEGWGPVRIGAASKAVVAFLGDGQPGSRYSSGYFKEYPRKGVQVSFENTSNTVHAIYFYNGQRDSRRFEVFCGHTNNGINWQSSVDEVEKAYGRPTAEFSGANTGDTWQRLVFDGIDFRFENGKLVRIGIPGN
jgi:hypothetical protein